MGMIVSQQDEHPHPGGIRCREWSNHDLPWWYPVEVGESGITDLVDHSHHMLVFGKISWWLQQINMIVQVERVRRSILGRLSVCAKDDSAQNGMLVDAVFECRQEKLLASLLQVRDGDR